VRAGISFGALYADPSTILQYILEAEKLGYDYVFLPDSQTIYRDPFPILGSAAVQTKNIVLGTMVSSVVTRHPSVLASAFHTVYELSAGRAIFILGRGDSSVRRVGKQPVEVTVFADKVNEVKQYLRGSSTPDNFRIRYASHDVPILIMATGEKMLRMAGWLGDGAAVFVGPTLANWALTQIQKGAQEAGVDIRGRLYLFTSFCSIHDDGAEAIAYVKPAVTWYCVNSPALVKSLNINIPGDFWKNIERFKENYARYDFVHEQQWRKAVEESSFIPDKLASALALAGTTEDVLDRLKHVAKSFREVVIRPVNPHRWYEVFKRFAEEIIPKIKPL
jgi:5,10-methylenetetrahydromethanopterin reductase